MRNVCIFALAIAAVASTENGVPVPEGCADPVPATTAKPSSQKYGYYEDKNRCWYRVLKAHSQVRLASCFKLCWERDDNVPSFKVNFPNGLPCLKRVKKPFQERADDGSPGMCLKGYCLGGRCITGHYTVTCSATQNRTYNSLAE
uniref:Evasin n=1 Tax=Amblyomma triste TaxID=251400 RepID=A0A023G8M1_AMBTT